MSSIITESDRQAEKERIHTLAVGTVLGACCQLFAAIAREMQAQCRRHDIDAMRIHISSKEEREASGLVESMLAALCDDLPVSPGNAVESHDDFDILDEDEIDEVAVKVRRTVEELLGVFRGKED